MRKPEHTPKWGPNERLIVEMLRFYASNDYAATNMKVHQLAGLAFCCLHHVWANTDSKGPLPALWQADASWFGPELPQHIQLKNGHVFGELEEHMKGLGNFCLKLSNRFIPLIAPLRQMYMVKEEAPLIANDNAPGKDVFRLFEFKTADIVEEEVLQHAVIDQIYDMVEDNGRALNAMTRIDWASAIDAGFVVLQAGAATLLRLRALAG